MHEPDRRTVNRRPVPQTPAAILHASLDTSSDIDVIQTLLDTPERFQSRIVLDHMDDALYEAKQILIAREIGDV